MTIKPATPNTVAFRSPNRMYYLCVNGEIVALCLTKAIALGIREVLDASRAVP